LFFLSVTPACPFSQECYSSRNVEHETAFFLDSDASRGCFFSRRFLGLPPATAIFAQLFPRRCVSGILFRPIPTKVSDWRFEQLPIFPRACSGLSPQRQGLLYTQPCRNRCVGFDRLHTLTDRVGAFCARMMRNSSLSPLRYDCFSLPTEGLGSKVVSGVPPVSPVVSPRCFVSLSWTASIISFFPVC